MASERRNEGAIRSVVNTKSLQLECANLLNEDMLEPVLMYGSKSIVWMEKDSSRVRIVQMNSLRSLLCK